MRILFMGTPQIAAESLSTLISAGHDICGVFTREDKPQGRKQIMTAPPVKQVAITHNIPVFQPKNLRDAEIHTQIKALEPQLIVVVAYGRILPPEVLYIPQYGCINLHVSLLPKYRGSAPVQWAVINGEKETGVSIMYLNEGVDTGDIIKVSPLIIGENETSGELFERISQEGASTLVSAICEIANGTVRRIPQDNSKATLAPLITKEMALFTFDASADTLHNLIRGMNPWPMAYFMHDGKKIKVVKSAVLDLEKGIQGKIVSLKPLTISCTHGKITLQEVVPEGSKPMSGEAWAAGKRFIIGQNI
ncbi:MAG: methionyl-tRNA formyltransferase [Oscillospiraceae bacterium]